MQPFEEILPQLRQNLQQIEERRIQSIASRSQGYFWIAMVLALSGLAGVIAVAAFSSLIPVVVAVVISLVLCVIIYSTKITTPYEEYRRHFKREFIGPLLSAFAENVQYFPAGDAAMMDHYHASQLYTRTPDRSRVEDSIWGQIGKTELCLSEIHTEYKTESRDKNGRRRTSWHTIFKGLLISADFHKDFQGSTFVRTDVAEKSLGQLGRFFQRSFFSSTQLVALEDPDFENEFVVHSTNQVEARYILSTSLMERMLELKRQFATPIEFSFLHSRMFIAISTNHDYFEPIQDRSVLSTEYLKSYYLQIHSCLGVVEELGLNVRIWSKQ